MTEPEDFLSRWSRRKRETKRDAAEQSADKPVERVVRADDAVEQTNANQTEAPAQPRPADEKRDEIFDLSKLPSLDSIGPATDIRIFLQPGVPEALSRAALRRAWSADPAIRDFIGLSENSWDFTANDGMHGFGALDPAEAKQVLARLLGGTEDERGSSAITEVADEGADSASGEETEPVSTDAGDGAGVSTDAAIEHREMLQASNSDIVSVASQHEEMEPKPASPSARRGHGRALPQ